MATIKSDPKMALQAQMYRDRKKIVRADIAKIDAALERKDEMELTALHRELDGKYQSCIRDWDKSMYGYFKDHGFNYEYLGIDSVCDNLATMRPKLESFVLGLNEVAIKGQTSFPKQSPDVNVTVNNTVNISISFEETRRKIEDMNALSQEQTDEIIAKIDELEAISKEPVSKKTKWEKVKPILAFVLDKGADVAIAIMTLIVQMKLGI